MKNIHKIHKIKESPVKSQKEDFNWIYYKNQEKIWKKIKQDLEYWRKSGKPPEIALTSGLSRWIAMEIQNSPVKSQEKVSEKPILELASATGELKTLKDIERTISSNYIVDELTDEVFMTDDKTFDNRIILPKELRAEAVKWVKGMDSQNKNVFGGLRSDVDKRWIIKFFNLTKKDLEGK